MGKIPYRLWSDHAPEPPPAPRTVIAKLKSASPVPDDVMFGIESGIGLPTSAPASSGSRVERLLSNARLAAIRPVFPAIAEDLFVAAVGGGRGLRAGAAQRRPVVRRARGLVAVEVASGEDPRKMARHLSNIGGEVEYAYVPQPRRMFAKRKPAPDPLLSRQWSHGAVRLAQARARASFTDADAIVVAVADSGIDKAHPDLKPVISEYKNFVKGESAKDFEGHGTHVAGIVAAATNNGIGVSGVCGAKILALKVLPSRVDWDAAGYYRALGYCIGRARVLNLSLGAETLDPGERDVIADLIEAGIVVVAAMGNEFEEGNPTSYPAALGGVCAVGATDHADRRGGFSNTGKHISLCAPGVGILSTTPMYSFEQGVSEYDSFDGTSMATPHVSAAAALLLAKDPELSPADVVRQLRETAARVPGMKKRPNPTFGWGRLDVDALLR
jgi:subtilisin family serine protease